MTSATGSPAKRLTVPLPMAEQLPPGGRAFLEGLVQTQLLGQSAAGVFLRQAGDRLGEFTNEKALGQALVQAGLLTAYQLDRLLAGTTHGLILGNHRVLHRLGAGSMGVVFLVEHLLLKRRAAAKVLPVDDDFPQSVLERFYAEMRVLADLHHPNVVLAYDAGRLPPPSPGMPALHYLVMEYVSGGDLEQYVLDHGAVSVAQACEWVRQAAAGLQEAHDHHLIHRDVKPSNLLLSFQGQVKLVDFGLARQFASNLTEPGTLLGSVEFMAPEQSFDPTAVSGKADIYGLGATLFWLLTADTPYPQEKSLARALRALQKERPRRLRDLRPDAPPELEALIDRMLDKDPDQRPTFPVTVMKALARFAGPPAPGWETLDLDATGDPAAGLSPLPSWHVLVADDDPHIRRVVRAALDPIGCICFEAEDGPSALALAQERPIDVVLLDLILPGLHGYEVCVRLREQPPRPHLKILILSGKDMQQELADALARGADDYLSKPFDIRQLAAKVQHTLRLKDAQVRGDLLARHLLLTNRQLETSLEAKSNDVRTAQDALLFAMAKLAESRDGETSGHLRRLQRYSRCLGEQLQGHPAWAGILDRRFLEQLERCVPLHDIGKLGLPDEVLLKPGPLDAGERGLMETHTILGSNMLESLGKQYGDSLTFLGMARAIVRHHHERYDGQGYPDRLAGDAIPPAARLVALGDVYDALRRKRFHKSTMSHKEAVKHILEQSPGQFDPDVLSAFAAREQEFERIYLETRT